MGKESPEEREERKQKEKQRRNARRGKRQPVPERDEILAWNLMLKTDIIYL